MTHTFIALNMPLIPLETKKYIPTFWGARFSNDGVKDSEGIYTTEPSFLLLDGYNDSRELVHSMQVLRAWTQWADDPDEVIQNLLDTAIEYTAEEINIEQRDVDSMWFIGMSELD